MSSPDLDELKDAFSDFRRECIWLFEVETLFSHLYNSLDKDVEPLLRRIAGGFFEDLNKILHEYWRLQVAKITDPAKSVHGENLTLSNIIYHMEQQGLDTSLIKPVVDEIQNYRKQYVEPVRNKLISHLDRKTIASRSELGGHSPEELNQFLSNLQKVNDLIAEKLGVSIMDLRIAGHEGDVLNLIMALRSI